MCTYSNFYKHLFSIPKQVLYLLCILYIFLYPEFLFIPKYLVVQFFFMIWKQFTYLFILVFIFFSILLVLLLKKKEHTLVKPVYIIVIIFQNKFMQGQKLRKV